MADVSGDGDGAGVESTGGGGGGVGVGAACASSARIKTVGFTNTYFTTMELDSLTAQTAERFLDTFLERFNDAARGADPQPMFDLFGEDAVLDFEGVPDWGPYEGKRAIEQRYSEDPPDDEIHVTRWKISEGRIIAEFRWKDIPEARGGCMIVALRAGLIARLTIALGGPEAHFR